MSKNIFSVNIIVFYAFSGPYQKVFKLNLIFLFFKYLKTSSFNFAIYNYKHEIYKISKSDKKRVVIICSFNF